MSKLGVVSANIFLLNFVTSIAGFICILIVKTGPFSIKAFFILAFYTFLLNFLFAAIGLFVSMLTKRPRPVTFQSIGIVLIFYFIDTIAKISEDISMLGYISPFRYVELNVIDKGYHLNLLHFAYFAGVSSILLIISWLLYRKREIYI